LCGAGARFIGHPAFLSTFEPRRALAWSCCRIDHFAGWAILWSRAPWAIRHGGSVFLLGRLVQDGLVQQVLDEVCPDPRFKLCAFKDVLPRTANDFVWGGDDAPLRQIGGLEGADDEAKALIIESLRRHPLDNVYFAARALFDRFFLFRTGDELGAFLWHTRWRVEVFFPDALASFDAALQQQKGKIDLSRIDPIHTGIIWIAACSAGLQGLSRGNACRSVAGASFGPFSAAGPDWQCRCLRYLFQSAAQISRPADLGGVAWGLHGIPPPQAWPRREGLR